MTINLGTITFPNNKSDKVLTALADSKHYNSRKNGGENKKDFIERIFKEDAMDEVVRISKVNKMTELRATSNPDITDEDLS